MIKTKYPEIDILIIELAEDISTVLGSHLRSLYISGSIVIGDFDSQRSDIDLVAMVAKEVSSIQLENLRKMHASFIKNHPAWRDRIEVAYVSVDGLKNFRTKAFQIARVAPGEPLHFRVVNIDWLMDWYLVVRYGQTVLGPAPEDLIPKISHQEFVQSLKSYMPNWLNDVKRAHHVGFQSYIILSLCRSLYVFTIGEQVSKIQAGKWAIKHYPDWAGLIKSALAWKGSPDNSNSPQTREQTEEFVNFVTAEVNRKF